MKKISRSDLQGLRCQFPVLTKEEMRRHVGGYSDSYWNGDWSSSDPYFTDFGANAGSSYGYGGNGDIDGGYLPEVVINGGSGYSGGYTYSEGNGYPGWGDGEDWGTGYGSYGYGSGDKGEIPRYNGLLAAIVNNNDCFLLCVGKMFGTGPVEIGNKYGDYLKSQGLSLDKINETIGQGTSSSYFENFMKNSLGVNTTKMDNATFKSTISNDSNLTGMGFVNVGRDEMGKTIYHAIIITGTTRNSDGDLVLKYSDPQNRLSMELSIDHISNFYKM